MRLDQRQALRAAGESVEALVAENLRRRDGEREGRQRQIEAAEPQGGKAEQEARAEADRAGDRNRRPIGKTGFRHQDRRAVAADGKKGAVAEGDLAVEAGEEIEAEQSNGENEHLRALIDVIAGSQERKGERAGADRERNEQAQGAVRPSHRQTLATRRRPNRPDGRQTKTPTMIASATESFTSAPTT